MNDQLKSKLDAWAVEPEIPARFQANVWAEIAARETRPARFLDTLVALFYQPLPTLALVTLALALSMGSAYVHAQDYNARHDKAQEALYMNSINPLAHPGDKAS